MSAQRHIPNTNISTVLLNKHGKEGRFHRIPTLEKSLGLEMNTKAVDNRLKMILIARLSTCSYQFDFGSIIKLAATKSALKGIKAAIDANDFLLASAKAADLVQQDSQSYTAYVFLGFAYDKLDNDKGAEEAYEAATKLRPKDPQALKGLIALYEKQGQKSLDKYHNIVVQLAEIYGSIEDQTRCQDVVDKYEAFAEKHGSRWQRRHALELHLPSSSLYSYLEGRIPHPSHTLLRIIESMEKDEKEWINGQIGERRTRLGAKIDQVMVDVRREAFAKYPLEALYREVIDWTNDDEVRRGFEEKMLHRAYENLLALPDDEKVDKRNEVLSLAKGMVIVKHPYELAWTITVEWFDAESLADWDVGIFHELIDFFPELGLSKVLRGFLATGNSPFMKRPDKIYEQASELPGEERLSEAHLLMIMVEGLDESPTSPLSHRIMGEVYLSLGEYRSAVETAQKAQALYIKSARDCGVALQNSLDAVNLTLANALIFYQAPRYHQKAKQLFEEIIARKPTATAPLSGIGLILEEQEDYENAVSFLNHASNQDPTNLKIKAELAWCRALSKDMLVTGLEQLEDTLREINELEPNNVFMKAQTLYRIGFCQWQLDDHLHPRGQKNGPYKYFIGSVKANPNFASAYTMLGIFFEEYGKSPKRARTAFQKAFELSTSELEAAHRLARIFANNGEWDLVELVAARVVQSGKATPPPGSKKKAQAWPFAALGVVELNRQQYPKSIVHFQRALRIAPHEYHCWVSLGECYLNSGRYVAAERAFHQAESSEDGLPGEETWFAKYMLANVKREMGAYKEAIEGYEGVLGYRNTNSSVVITLLQTLTESAWARLQAGTFGEASRQAGRALEIALDISSSRTNAFNLWKAVGDACSLLACVPLYAQKMKFTVLQSLLAQGFPTEEMERFGHLDGICLSSLQHPSQGINVPDELSNTYMYLIGGIMANKRAILVASDDAHAQAVSWYNLGWMEHRLCNSASLGRMSHGRLRLKAAMKCFKRAIELEAGNPEFWNGFGIATMDMHPALSQHAFVRSLHLNDKSPRVWTNLGAFYMTQNDNELANEAFIRAQSLDPDYAYTWLGQGLLATLVGKKGEARRLFAHAFDISTSCSTIVRQQYAFSVFDHILRAPSQAADIESHVQALFALHQLRLQAPLDVIFNHLTALISERLDGFERSEESLQAVCTVIAAERDEKDSLEAVFRFSQAKSDLARVQLARHEFDKAVESSDMALELTLEDGSAGEYSLACQKCRLSALLTGGLARYFLCMYDEAVSMFQKALNEADEDADVVCTLAQVLWARGGCDERALAREHLFSCIEKHPDHVGAVILLGVIALLDGDRDAIDAVEGDLQAMRLDNKLDVHNRGNVMKVLAAVSASAVQSGQNSEEAAVHEATKSIMISPGQPGGWISLAVLSSDIHAADMAVVTAVVNVPPKGDLDAEELSKVYSLTCRRRDALQAIMVAPWEAHGWGSLGDSLSV